MINTKKEKIIEVASNLFESNSYLSIGVDRIINESNVAKMTFYKYFPSKELLIMTVLEKRKVYILSSLVDFVNNPNIQKEKIELLFLWFKKWFSNENFHGCMFIKCQEEFPNNDNFKKINLNYKENLFDFVYKLLLDMNISNACELSSFFLILIDGLTIKANLKTLTEDDLNFVWKLFEKELNS